MVNTGGTSGTVVACWISVQQVKRSILHRGHDSNQNSSHQPRQSQVQYGLTLEQFGLNHHPLINSFMHSFIIMQEKHYFGYHLYINCFLGFITVCSNSFAFLLITQTMRVLMNTTFSIYLIQYSHIVIHSNIYIYNNYDGIRRWMDFLKNLVGTIFTCREKKLIGNTRLHILYNVL